MLDSQLKSSTFCMQNGKEPVVQMKYFLSLVFNVVCVFASISQQTECRSQAVPAILPALLTTRSSTRTVTGKPIPKKLNTTINILSRRPLTQP